MAEDCPHEAALRNLAGLVLAHTRNEWARDDYGDIVRTLETEPGPAHQTEAQMIRLALVAAERAIQGEPTP